MFDPIRSGSVPRGEYCSSLFQYEGRAGKTGFVFHSCNGRPLILIRIRYEGADTIIQ